MQNQIKSATHQMKQYVYRTYLKPVNIITGTINAILIVSLLVLSIATARAALAQEMMDRLQADEVNIIMRQLATYAEAETEYKKQLECLARNIYFEARSEGALGQRAVAWVTLNRMHNPRFPNTICEVVHQGLTDSNGNMLKNKCQFSWYCDGKTDKINNLEKWNVAVTMAETVLSRYGANPDPTDGAIMYHADYVKPNWMKDFLRTTKIDTHVFYAESK